MTDPITIRASSLSGYTDCPRRAAAKMFAAQVRAMGYEIRRPPGSIGASVGSGTHAGAAALLTDKIAGRTPSLDQATNAAIEVLRDRIRDEEALMDDVTPSVAVAERQVIRMTKAYADFVAPEVNPQFVEQRLEAKVPFTTTAFVLSGQSDVLAREPDKLRDHKTGKTRTGNHKPQFGGYSLLARTHGRGVKSVVEDFLQRVAISRPQPRPIQFKFDLQTCEMSAVAVLRQIDLNYQLFINGWPERGIEAGDPTAFPANPSSMLCSEKWCPAHGTKFCVEHKTDDREPERPLQPQTTDIPEFLK